MTARHTYPPKKLRHVMHAVPIYDDLGEVRELHWFGTMTEAKTFAKEQCRRLGQKGYCIHSYTREVVADLLSAHVPTSEALR